MEDVLHAAQALNDCLAQLRQSRIDVTMKSDFTEYADLHNRSGKPALSAFFDPEKNEFLPHKAFWMCGTNDAGDIVLSQAMRLDSLGTATLRELWVQKLPRLFGTARFDPSPGRRSAILDKIRGDVVYHGDLWLAESLRGQNLGPAAARFAMALATIRWWPDWLVGLMRNPVVKSGFGLREGYMHFEQIGDEFQWGHPFIDEDNFLVWMELEDVKRMFRQYHTYPRKTA